MQCNGLLAAGLSSIHFGGFGIYTVGASGKLSRRAVRARVGAHSPAPLSRHVERIMGELALHGKATGAWSEGNFRRG